MCTWQRESLLKRDKPVLSSERMLRKYYDCKSSVAEKKLWLWAARGMAPRQTGRLTVGRNIRQTDKLYDVRINSVGMNTYDEVACFKPCPRIGLKGLILCDEIWGNF
jgi:hypothetical protein